jgi:hypothetical protein
LRDIDIVEHGDREPVAAVRPREPAVVADVNAAVIRVVDTIGRSFGYQQVVMVSVRVVRLASVSVPTGYLLPRLPGVSREMEIDAAAEDLIRIFWMNCNRVPVRDLTFLSEVVTADLAPRPTRIDASENP